MHTGASQVARWYQGWKSLFPLQLVTDTGIAAGQSQHMTCVGRHGDASWLFGERHLLNSVEGCTNLLVSVKAAYALRCSHRKAAKPDVKKRYTISMQHQHCYLCARTVRIQKGCAPTTVALAKAYRNPSYWPFTMFLSTPAHQCSSMCNKTGHPSLSDDRSACQ